MILREVYRLKQYHLRHISDELSSLCQKYDQAEKDSRLLKAALENFEKEKCKLITLADYDVMIQQAAENNYIKDSDMQSLIEWREHPKKWAEKFK